MERELTRRSFLKSGLLAMGAAAASPFMLPATVRGASETELATLIDIRKCVGCEACVEACRDVNETKFPQPKKPFPKMYPPSVQVQDWSDKTAVTDRLTPYNWLYIQHATVMVNGRKETLSIPRRCMHCQNPPCANLCPWGAARKLKNGISVIEPNICLGGAKCQDVCPWEIPQRQTGVGLYLKLLPSLAGNGVMYKCDRCHEGVSRNELPACIEICPEGVQKIGPRKDMVKEAMAVAQESGSFLYGIEENGGTNTIYISPVPFEVLNEAIAKGDGRPHLRRVEDSMAHADHLAKAMVIAPIAGVAAAALRLVQMSAKVGEGKK